MGKIIFDTGIEIDDVMVNGDGFETNTEVDQSVFSKENLAKVTFKEGGVDVQVYKDAKLAFFFTLIENDTQKHHFGFYEESNEQRRETDGISQLAELLLTDDQAYAVPFLFQEWNPNGVEYVANISKVTYHELLWKCLTTHTSQESWNPKDAHSLWVRIDDPAEEWPEWRQPEGAHDAYAKGAKVTHNEKHWISDVDNNVWEPGVYGWTESPIEEETA